MGKRSQAMGRWPKRKLSPHVYSMQIRNPLGVLFRVLAKGLSRPDKTQLQKQLKERA